MPYRFATAEDIPLLTRMRLEFMNLTPCDPNYSLIDNNCLSYFRKAFEDGSCDAVLAEDAEGVFGTGIIFYYNSVPSTFNPEGKNAYITSMYVAPPHRRKGHARHMLNMLIHTAKEKGYPVIMLSASDMGRPLYEQEGFYPLTKNMLLDTRKSGE